MHRRYLFAFDLQNHKPVRIQKNTKTTAKLENGQWVLNGSKIFITNASSEITLGSIVQAITGVDSNSEKIFSVIIVENGTVGFTAKTMHDKMMRRASNTSELFFDDCRVPEENILRVQMVLK